jgi:hypothetical protein
MEHISSLDKQRDQPAIIFMTHSLTVSYFDKGPAFISRKDTSM